MVDIEPFKYQKSTNIDEHNQIVSKINEVVNVINETNLDVLGPRVTANEIAIKKNTTDIDQLKISDAELTKHVATIDGNINTHAREISGLKASDIKQISDIAEINTVVDALTRELPTEITLYRDGTGKIRAQVTQEDNTTFDSNTLDMIIPYQYDIISGTTSRSFKLDITTSDGSHIVTNDFVIPEGSGTSVSITSITLKKDTTNPNKVKVSVGLNDTSSIESGYVDIVNSVSGTFANNKLTVTVNGISSVPITIDATGTTYSAGEGIKIENGKISINDIINHRILNSLDSAIDYDPDSQTVEFYDNYGNIHELDLSSMESREHANSKFATKTEHTILQQSVGPAFKDVAVGSDGKSLDFTALNGQVNNIVLPSSGSGDYVPATYPVENGGKILGISGNGTVEPKDSSFVTPMFSPRLTSFTDGTTFFNSFKAGGAIGNMVTFICMGKTASGWSASLSGIVEEKGDTSIRLIYIGGNLWDGTAIVPIGSVNYNGSPSITVSANGLHIYKLKGNSTVGTEYKWSDCQGWSTIIYR